MKRSLALHIMRELLRCNQWSRSDQWLSNKYIQHNPMAASGLDGVKKYFIEVAKRVPTATCTKLTSPVVAVQAEGNYVTVLAIPPSECATSRMQHYPLSSAV